MTQNCVLGLTGEPSADSNMLTLGPDPDAEGFLVRAVARARERGLGLSATMTPHVAEAPRPGRRRGLGPTPVGRASLMVLRPETPVRLGRRVRVDRALGSELAGIAGDIIAAAFEAPRDVVARSIEVGMTETSGVETYIAWGDEGPTSTLSSVTPGTEAYGRDHPHGHGAGAPAQGHGPRPAHSRRWTTIAGRGVDRFYLGHGSWRRRLLGVASASRDRRRTLRLGLAVRLKAEAHALLRLHRQGDGGRTGTFRLSARQSSRS